MRQISLDPPPIRNAALTEANYLRRIDKRKYPHPLHPASQAFHDERGTTCQIIGRRKHIASATRVGRNTVVNSRRRRKRAA
jgi:hypothetical protein